MKRTAYFFLAATLFFATSCEKCATCTFNPGSGGATQTSSFCGTDEIDGHEALGWDCN